MVKSEKKKVTKEPKQYMQNVPRKFVYGGLAAFALVAVLLFLCVPHYKPTPLATDQQINDAHHDIIKKFFVLAVTCKDDKKSKHERIIIYNKYFEVNQYANRAVYRDCHGKDVLVVKDDEGNWQKTNVFVSLDFGLSERTNEACLTKDIIKTSSIADGTAIKKYGQFVTEEDNTLKLCNKLAKESYIEINFRTGIHFHF